MRTLEIHDVDTVESCMKFVRKRLELLGRLCGVLTQTWQPRRAGYKQEVLMVSPARALRYLLACMYLVVILSFCFETHSGVTG